MAERISQVSPDLRRALIAVSLSLASLVLLAQLGHLWTRNSEFFAVDGAKLEPLQLPAWVPSLWSEEANRAFREGKTRSIFDPTLLQEVRERLTKLPFVEKVDEISREFPRSLHARITVRRPVALLKVGSKLFPLDRYGVFLPAKFQEVQAGFPFAIPVLLISGVSPPTGDEIGKRSRDPRLLEALSAACDLDAIYDYWPEFSLVSIDCENLGGKKSSLESEIVLYLENNLKILWGRASWKRPYGELSVESKIQNLEKVRSQFPDLKGIRELDLRFDRPSIILENG